MVLSTLSWPPWAKRARISNFDGTQGVKISAEDLKLESEECAQGGSDWRKLCPEMLDLIFHHLPVADLLSCGMVCKTWKTAARDMLQRNRECYAYIQNFRPDIQHLNEMMDGMDLINGLYIQNRIQGADDFVVSLSNCRAGAGKDLQCKETEINLEVGKQSVLKVLGRQWKYIAIDMRWDKPHCLRKADSLLLREVISATSGSLQKLLLGDGRDWDYVPCSGINYPELKSIHAQKEQLLNPSCENFSLQAMAPNLEKITGAMIKVHVPDIVESFALERIQGMRIEPFMGYPDDEHEHPFRSVSRLRGLNLQSDEVHRSDLCDPEELDSLLAWNSFGFPLVLRNLNTLVELRMISTEFYKLVITTDELKFPTLERLSLTLHENAIPVFKQLNLAKLCPNLEQVHLRMEFPEILDEEVVDGLQEEPLELIQSHQPLTVELECMEYHTGDFYRHECLQHLNTMYPNIMKVKFVKLDQVNETEMSKIFLDLNTMESLELSVSLEKGNCVVDPFLSGINKEEADLPFRKDASIVPIRASLFNAKSLKELRIFQQLDDDKPIQSVSQSWVAQITENVPVRHIRDLRVTLEGSQMFVDELRWRAFSTYAPLRKQINEDLPLCLPSSFPPSIKINNFTVYRL